jgi:nucleoside-diphosphate-sugar epimerase
MSVVVVTGSCGLIGSESAAHYASLGYDVAGVDNDLRRTFFGPEASTVPVAAFDAVAAAPPTGEVYNIGGGRACHCSMIEAIAMAEDIAGRTLDVAYDPKPRIGDHIWYLSNLSKFQQRYPDWRPRFDERRLLEEIYEANVSRWIAAAS